MYLNSRINIHGNILQTKQNRCEIYICIVDPGLRFNNVAERFKFKQGAY